MSEGPFSRDAGHIPDQSSGDFTKTFDIFREIRFFLRVNRAEPDKMALLILV